VDASLRHGRNATPKAGRVQAAGYSGPCCPRDGSSNGHSYALLCRGEESSLGEMPGKQSDEWKGTAAAQRAPVAGRRARIAWNDAGTCITVTVQLMTAAPRNRETEIHRETKRAATLGITHNPSDIILTIWQCRVKLSDLSLPVLLSIGCWRGSETVFRA
jgi:hypothetical protein